MKDWLTVEQASEEIGIEPGAVRDAVARGSLHAERLGGGRTRAGLLLIERDEIARYLRENRGRPGRKRARHGAGDNRDEE